MTDVSKGYLQDDNKMIEITIMTPEKAVGVKIKKQGKWLPLITNIPNFLVITQKHWLTLHRFSLMLDENITWEEYIQLDKIEKNKRTKMFARENSIAQGHFSIEGEISFDQIFHMIRIWSGQEHINGLLISRNRVDLSALLWYLLQSF